MGPNDWVGDQCDMTLVGGFSRQRREISAVLLRIRGSWATGSVEVRWAGSLGRPLQNINVRREIIHTWMSTCTYHTCSNMYRDRNHESAWINYIRQNTEDSSAKYIFDFFLAVTGITFNWKWVNESVSVAVRNTQCQAAVPCRLSKSVSPKKKKKNCFPWRRASALIWFIT